ncbi:hypothetical protein TNIN_66581 [Trichonephila inaurata madagascariensis]|uniref:Uncharacterized protein n=1 Tax=Trichonephila inaurata madagascariensis TaxID=2747483 RepID=A0A8X6MCM1_9ARAC|nr:hypothetical protein TNIN_66581 [Trichonephila inaurata madagascariensis]
MSGPFFPKEALPFVVFKVSMGFNWPSTCGELQMKVWSVICATENGSLFNPGLGIVPDNCNRCLSHTSMPTTGLSLLKDSFVLALFPVLIPFGWGVQLRCVLLRM